MKINRAAYQRVIDEDLAWLESAPRTLERDHVITIVQASLDHEYPRPYFDVFMEAINNAIRDGLAAADAALTPEQREKAGKFDEILRLVGGGMEPIVAARQVLSAPPRADALVAPPTDTPERS